MFSNVTTAHLSKHALPQRDGSLPRAAPHSRINAVERDMTSRNSTFQNASKSLLVMFSVIPSLSSASKPVPVLVLAGAHAAHDFVDGDIMRGERAAFDGEVLRVVFTERGGDIRLISAWKAGKDDSKKCQSL